MNDKRKLFFILNPMAGSGTARSLLPAIKNHFKDSGHEIGIEITAAKGDGQSLTIQGIDNGFDTIIAVGGDGTINEVSTGLLDSGCKMGILPVGSGNGLARHYNIPFDLTSAINVILKDKVTLHDAIKINDFYSFNVSGLGFDAHVAHLFEKSTKRGLSGYAKLVLQEYFKYKSFPITITYGNNSVTANPFLVAIANTSQFGNNAFIAPAADPGDGLADLTIVNKTSFINTIRLIRRLFNKSLVPDKNIIMLRNDSYTLLSDHDIPLHIDGEAAGYHRTINIDIIKGAIRLITP